MTGNLKMFAQNSTFAKSSFPGLGQLNTVGFNEMKGKPVEFGCQSFGRMVVVPSLVLTGAVRYLGAGTNSRVSIASAKVIRARLLQNTPRVPEGVMFSLVERPE